MESIVKYIVHLINRNIDSERISIKKINWLIFLLDWKSCVELEASLTSLNWYYMIDGPYFEEFKAVLDETPFLRDYFILSNESTIEKENKIDETNYQYSHKEIELLNFIDHKILKLDEKSLVRLIHSVYPIIHSQKYQRIDLEGSIEGYKNSVRLD